MLTLVFEKEVLGAAIETAQHNAAAAKDLLLSWGCPLAPQANADTRTAAAAESQPAEASCFLPASRAAAEFLAAAEHITATADAASAYAAAATSAAAQCEYRYIGPNTKQVQNEFITSIRI